MTEEIKQRIEMIRRGEVPEGYVRRDSGIIPRAWSYCQLGSLGEFKNGLNFLRSDSGYKIRFLGVGDFQNRSEIHDINGLEIIELSEKPAEEYYLKDEDIVFVRSNGSKELVGRNLQVFPGDNKVSFSGFCIRFRLTCKEKTTPRFINLLLDNGALKSKLRKDNRGTNINNLNQDMLCNLTLNLPNWKEQEKICEVLTFCNKVIELKENLIFEKQQQKKYLTQILLTGKTRLSGFARKWKKVKLNKVVTEAKRKHMEQNLRICSVAVKKGVIDQIEHLGRSYAANDTSNYNVVSYGDLVYTKSPTGNFPYGIIKQSHLKEDVVVSPLYGVFTPVNFALGYILHCYFEYPTNTDNYLLPIIQKGAKNTINIKNDTFISNSLYLPMDIEEQKAIADIFITANRELEVLQKDLEQWQQKKKALMQLLLTGIVRVKI